MMYLSSKIGLVAVVIALMGSDTTHAQKLVSPSFGLNPVSGQRLPYKADTKSPQRRVGIKSIGTLTVFAPLGAGKQGILPGSGLIQARDGNFYGTTTAGGNHVGGTASRGTVYKVTPIGRVTTLVDFNGTVAQDPRAALVQAKDGSFYGTTSEGGTFGRGTVFRILNGRLTILLNFNGTNGANPRALIQASDGNFYGTTVEGGRFSFGTVYKMTPNGVVTTLFSFNGRNGRSPRAALVQARDGNFYGTTAGGGTNNPTFCFQGCGTIFKITPAGTLTTLRVFNGLNGGEPQTPLIQARDGNFYGTTSVGGTGDCPLDSACGTVFRISSQGIFTTLVNFKEPLFGAGTGMFPNGLIQARDGNFYGTTFSGLSGHGNIFRMRASGAITILASFTGAGTGGRNPVGELIQTSSGDFYGATFLGGRYSVGTVFKFKLP